MNMRILNMSAFCRGTFTSNRCLIPTLQYSHRFIFINSSENSQQRSFYTRHGPVLQETVVGEDSWLTSGKRPSYETHRPTTCLQKGILTVGSAFMALYDPYRHDMVATLGETTGPLALRRLHRIMKNHPEGNDILRERPRINSSTVDMAALGRLPGGTLGREYHDFMAKNKITADSRVNVQYVDDSELAYVMQRYREVHDLYHCLLGLPTTMLGEVVVKWYEMVNTRLPMCILGALFGPLRLSFKRRKRLREHYIPEVFRLAPKSELLLNCYFERRWEQPIDDVRSFLRMEVIAKPGKSEAGKSSRDP